MTSTTATLSESPTSVRAAGKVFWRWKWLFVLVVVAIPAAAYFVDASKPDVYSSSVTMNIQSITVDASLSSGLTPQPATGTSLAAIAEIVHTTPIAGIAAPALHQTAGQVLGESTVTADQNTGFVIITATAPSPARAVQIATLYARAVSRNRTAAALRMVNQAIAQLERQLKSLPKRSVQTLPLSDQLQQLRAVEASQGSNAQVVVPPTVSGSPTSPRPVHAALLGFLLAIFIGFGVVFAAENLDHRIRQPASLEEILDLPVLSAFPKNAFTSASRHDHHAQEAFRMLRTGVTYFNVDRDLDSILIASPVPRDGKTTVAVNLAEVFARTGQRVVLLDADLRRPRASSIFGVKDQGPGLGEVLLGEATLTKALREVELGTRRSSQLSILPAGTRPPNPSELIASQRMEGVIQELRSMFDLIVIDTSPALAVPDPIPLFRQVSGILMVAKMNSTSKDSMVRLQRLVVASDGVLLGVVATGLTSHAIGEYYGYTSRYGYRYGYGKHAASYYAEANGGGGRLSALRIFRRRHEAPTDDDRLLPDENRGARSAAE